MPDRVLAARAGLIVGPHENIGRLPRWLWRCAECGEVLAPGRHPTLDAAPRRPV
jgi:2'-hydroxyisoflavone reductase